MSIQSIDAGASNQWLESLATQDKSAAGSSGTEDSLAARPGGVPSFLQLIHSFGGADAAAGAAAQSSTGPFPGAAALTLSGSGAAAASQGAGVPAITGRTAVDAGRAAISNPASATTPPATDPTTPPPGGSTVISEDNPQQMCTLAQAQAVQAAFPNSTLEIWTDSGPLPASSLSGIDPSQPMPYVIAFGTNSVTGGPNLYYAGVIVNEGAQAMAQTGYGKMTAGDYYVWNNTPGANGTTGVTDAGSSFTQFAQYYAQQLIAGNPVNPDVYTPLV